MSIVPSRIQRVQKTQPGFTGIQNTAEGVFASQGKTETLLLANELFACDIWTGRDYFREHPMWRFNS